MAADDNRYRLKHLIAESVNAYCEGASSLELQRLWELLEYLAEGVERLAYDQAIEEEKSG